MAETTIASLEDVRNAGNISQKVDAGTLQFYLDFTSFFLREIIGITRYNQAVAGSLSPSYNNVKLKIAEAMLAVGFSLPAVGVSIAEQGMLRSFSTGGRGGELETVSFTKEIMELANTFISTGHAMIPSSYISADAYKQVWYNVVMRVFPGLDEIPTMGTIASYAESLLKYERGDQSYDPTKEG